MNNKKSVLYRWFFMNSVSSNYEKMQALAYCYAILPALKSIYKDKDKLNRAVINHLQFFNTNPWIAPYILGINVAMEETGENQNIDNAVTAIKTGLMGPVAGLGDSLFVVIPWTIFGAIAANMALEGSAIGIFIWIFVSIILKLLSIPLFNSGYSSGTALISKLQNSLKIITECASILGLMVVGALIPTVIRANLAIEFIQGELVMSGQSILDKIMPGIIPVTLVSISLFLLKKNIKPIYLILSIMFISIISYAIGFLK